MDRRKLLLEAVKRGKYAPLYEHLSKREGDEWRTSFSALEKILGFSLPKSAWLYRPWWANEKKSGHSQAMAWTLSGWRTKDVDLDEGQLTFFREKQDGSE